MAPFTLPPLSEIKQRRKKLGLSQTALAKQAGVSQSLIAKIEAARIAPSYAAVQKIFDVFRQTEQKTALRARDIMTKPVLTVSPEDKVSKAIRIMKEKGLSQLPVTNGKHLVGSISEKAILDKAVEVGTGVVSKLPIEDVMDDPFPTVTEDAPVDVLLALLQHSWAVLITKKDSIAGIVTKADLLKVV